MDTSKLCRSCMKEVASWERENFDIRAVEMYCFCTNIKITNNDKLPKQFCYDCIIKIESSFTYITEAQKVDAVLKNLISRNNTSVIVEPEPYKNIDMKLTLPDYKVCESVDNNEHFLYDNTELPIENGHKNDETMKEKMPEDNKIQQNEVEEAVKEATNVNEIKKHICPMCRKVFTSKLWFNKHMQKEHNGPKFICEHCQKAFSKKWELTQHSVCHTEERKYTCPECGKCFKRRKQLSTHARAHADARPFECDKCGMKFKFKSVLKSHMNVHDGDKQYLCYFCGWSFALAGNLAVHMRKHTGEKPYACGSCSFRAADASSLKRHQRRHARARTHVCNHCNKGFYDSSSLSRHERVHTGERPFQCPGCARTFADSWKRKTHLMRAHRLALADIPRMTRGGDTRS